MVEDKHAKALDFMVNIKFSCSCISFAAETKQCGCLAQFLGKDICQEILASISYDLWNSIADDSEEEMIKKKLSIF